MAENQIRIQKIRLKELASWAAECLNHTAYKRVVPVTLTRAAAQTKNPYARPEDVVLLVAFSGDQCIGYHGLLPAVFRHRDGSARVHWATTFFVAPAFRGRGIGKYLLQEIKNIKMDFIVCQMTESARHAYRSSGLEDLGELNYFQLRVDRLDVVSRFFDATAGRSGNKSARPQSRPPGLIRLLQRPVYRLTKRLFYRLAVHRSGRPDKRKFTWKIVDRIDESRLGQPDRQPAGASFFRGMPAVNWMLDYPWVVSGNQRQTRFARYYFSDVRDIFRYVAMEINSEHPGGSPGFLVLSISAKKKKTRLKILDFYFKNPADEEIAVCLALNQARACLADRIEYPCRLADYFSRRAEFKKLIKKQTRLYMYYPQSSRSPLSAWRGKIAFDYCDGDTALT